MNPHINVLTHETIGAAIEVHRLLGPGLLESTYRECLCRELALRGISFRREYGTSGIQRHSSGLRLSNRSSSGRSCRSRDQSCGAASSRP